MPLPSSDDDELDALSPLAPDPELSDELRQGSEEEEEGGSEEEEDDGEDEGGNGSDYDDEGSSEEEEEEEEEPQLKYQRLHASVAGILKQDSALCLVANEKILVLGTQQGRVFVLDFGGNEVKRMHPHSGPINDMVLDSTGEFIATCSDDGTVVISNWASDESEKHSYNRPVKAIALPHNYVEKKIFAAGGLNQQFVINSKGWFSNKDNVIHTGEGPIYALAWQGDLIAWANNLGVKVYDYQTQERLAHISRPKHSPRPNLHRCHLVWSNPSTLIVGWADSVKVCSVRERMQTPGRPRGRGGAGEARGQTGSSGRFVQVTAHFQTDFFISGICPFGPPDECGGEGSGQLAVLAYVAGTASDDEDDAGAGGQGGQGEGEGGLRTFAERPELRVITMEGTVLSSDALPINGYQLFAASDYRLANLPEEFPGGEQLLYIVSPKDIVVARPRDLDDHIAWLLARDRFEEALEAAEQGKAQLKHHKVMTLGEKYLRHLTEQGEYVKAAQACGKLLHGNEQLWETWVLFFYKKRQLGAISPYIPIEKPQLSETVYEMVLNYFLENDEKGFLETVKTWRKDLYSMESIILAVNGKLRMLREFISSVSSSGKSVATSTKATTLLMEALAHLYILDVKYDKAVQVYLELGDSEQLFQLVQRLKLLDSVRNKVKELMSFDSDKATELFIENVEEVPVEDAVKQLENHPSLLHNYLHALFCKDAGIGYSFHERQVELYAAYQPNMLMPFLRNSNHYTLEHALQVCEKKEMYPEMVFIYRRMGNLNIALSIIIEKLCDVEQAIAFVEEHRDETLWEELIARSLDSSHKQFLADLLEHVGSHYIDLLRLVRRIPDDLEIPNLKNKLNKILNDQMLQVSVRSGCNKILEKDCVSLQLKLHRQQNRAVKVQAGRKCLLCDGPVFQNKMDSVAVFMCSHVYHSVCLDSQRQNKRAAPVCLRCGEGETHTSHAKRKAASSSGVGGKQQQGSLKSAQGRG